MTQKYERVASEDALDEEVLDCNAFDGSGLTPLHRACMDEPWRIDEILSTSGVIVNLKSATGQTALHYACKYQPICVPSLLASPGIEVNLRDVDQNTPLHYAIKHCYALVPILLMAGADPKLKDSIGRNALVLSIYHHSIIDGLIDLVDLHDTDNDGFTALHYAVQHTAAHVPVLLRRGANVNAKTKTGCTALHMSSMHGSTLAIKMVLEHGGCDVNVQNKDGRTPLHYAASANIAAIPMLVKAGAELEVRDTAGATPLLMAANSSNGNAIDAFELLVRLGADPNAQDLKGRTALHLVCPCDFDRYNRIAIHTDRRIKTKIGRSGNHCMLSYWTKC